jgi:chromosome segregation ATPase
MSLDPTMRRLQRRLDRWELEHLREHAAELAARVEDLEQRLADADQAADFWREQVLQLQEDIEPGAQIAMTVDGALHVIQEPVCQA